KVLSTYLEARLSDTDVVNLNNKARPGECPCRARLIQVKTANNQKSWSIPFGQSVAFDIWVESRSPVANIELGVGLFSIRGFELASWTNRCSGAELSLRLGLNVFRIEYTDMLLLPGQYYVGIGLRSERGFEDYVPEAFSFEILVSQMSARINAETFGGVVVPKVVVSTLTEDLAPPVNRKINALQP